MIEIFAVLTNLAFVPAAVISFYTHFYAEGFVYSSVVFFSSAYHICDSTEGLCFIGGLVTQSRLDFFFATFTIPMSFLTWIDWGPYVGVKFILLFIYATIVGVMLSVGLYSNVILIALSASALLILAIYWGIFYRWYGRWPSYDWYSSVIGSTLCYMGCAFFLIQDNNWKLYDWTHGAWHLASGLGQAFIILSTVPFVLEREFELLSNTLYKYKRKFPHFTDFISNYYPSVPIREKMVVFNV